MYVKTKPWLRDSWTPQSINSSSGSVFLSGHIPTQVDVAILPQEEPGHLLAVPLEVVLHILWRGFFLLRCGISGEGDLQVSQDPSLEKMSELFPAMQYSTVREGWWFNGDKVCMLQLSNHKAALCTWTNSLCPCVYSQKTATLPQNFHLGVVLGVSL